MKIGHSQIFRGRYGASKWCQLAAGGASVVANGRCTYIGLQCVDATPVTDVNRQAAPATP